MRDRTWQEELRHLYEAEFGELGGAPLSDIFLAPVKDVIGRDARVELIHPVKVGDKNWFLFVLAGDIAHLVRFEQPNITELMALGDLRGGRYIERSQVEPKAWAINMLYEHRRLGRGKSLDAGFTRTTGPRAAMSDLVRWTEERGEDLRKTFQRWSTPKRENPPSGASEGS